MAAPTPRNNPDILALAMAEPKAAPAADLLERIRKSVASARDLEIEVEEMAERLKEKKAFLLKLTQRELPDLMGEAKMDTFGLEAEGNLPAYDVKIRPFYSAKIPDERVEEANDWFADNGHGDLVKNVFTIQFGKGEAKQAEKLRERLSKAGYEYTQKESVHTQTLLAFIREQIEVYGEPIPLDLFGATVGRVAKIAPRGEMKFKSRK